jgi:hypothetical protein
MTTDGHSDVKRAAVQRRFIPSPIFQRRDVAAEAVLRVGLHQSFIGLVHFLDRDDFNIGGDIMFASEIQHFLCFGDPADILLHF